MPSPGADLGVGDQGREVGAIGIRLAPTDDLNVLLRQFKGTVAISISRLIINSTKNSLKRTPGIWANSLWARATARRDRSAIALVLIAV